MFGLTSVGQHEPITLNKMKPFALINALENLNYLINVMDATDGVKLIFLVFKNVPRVLIKEIIKTNQKKFLAYKK